jgi:hypothetical protein
MSLMNNPGRPLGETPFPGLVSWEVLRVSRVVQLILDAELEPAKGLGVLVDRVLESGISRY